jgi:PAS domain S-box-containing protein
MKQQPDVILNGFPTDGDGHAVEVRPRVLLADEDAELRETAGRVLAECYAVEVVADGDSALMAVRRQLPDLVIAGRVAARGDGWLGELRADPRTEAIPVIVLAERTGEGCRLDGLDARADDFLVRPFFPCELMARVRVQLAEARRRREAEQAVREREYRFGRFMENLPGLAWVKDLQGRYVYANNAAEKAFDTRCELLYGRTDEEIFPPETAAQFRENDRRALADAAGIRTIETLEHEDGLVHYSIVSKFPIPGADGTVALVGGMAIDITDLKRTEDALRQSEEQFRQLADAVPQIVYVTLPDGATEYLNQRWRDFTGHATADQEVLAAVIHPDDLPSLLARWSDAAARGTALEAEFRLKRASDGEYRWFLTRAVPVRDAQGAIAKWFGTSTDIDDRKRAELRQELLAEAGRLLSSALDYGETLAHVCRLVVPIFADWCQLDLLAENGELQRLEIAHKDPAKIEFIREIQRRYPPLSDDHALMKVIRTGEPIVAFELTDQQIVRSTRDPDHLRLVRSLGLRSVMIIPLTARGRTLGALTLIAAESARRYDQDDQHLAMELGGRVALAVDNARLFAEAQEAARRREEALQRHCQIEEQLTLLVEASGSLSASLDMGSVTEAVLTLSRRLVAADAHAVWRHQAATGRWGIVLGSGLSEDYQRSTIEVLEHTPRLPETAVVAEDVCAMAMLGHRRDAYDREGIRSMLVVPLSVRGSLTGTLAFYYRTPHRFSEVEVHIATALANLASSAIGSAELYDELRANDRRKDEFLAMLAHELRNPLSAISNSAALIGYVGPLPEAIASGMDIIGRQVKQLVRLIDDLLDVSRITRGKIQLRKAAIDAYAVLASAVESVRPFIEERRHQLTLSFQPGLMLEADPTRLEQIVVNLLNNAAKYTEGGGEIWLTARCEEAEIVIRVRDNGIGIPPEQLPKMFELFAQGDRSLARAEGGLGIGLTLVQKLAEMHGGIVQARSQGPGTGSEFLVRLPAAVPRDAGHTAGTAEPAPPRDFSDSG